MREDILNNLLRDEDDLKNKIKKNRKIINKMLKDAQKEKSLIYPRVKQEVLK